MADPFYNCPIIPKREVDKPANYNFKFENADELRYGFYTCAKCKKHVDKCVCNLESGQKFDQDKPRMELLDPYAMEQLALVLTFGAKKYGEWNWSKGLSYSRLAGAALRHIWAFMAGNENDNESGLPHLAHCFCCIMMLLAMTKRHSELDDRNKEG